MFELVKERDRAPKAKRHKVARLKLALGEGASRCFDDIPSYRALGTMPCATIPP